MINFGLNQRTKRKCARDEQTMLDSSSVSRHRKANGLTVKMTRQLKNEHRRHRKGINKSNILWTDRATRKDIVRQK